jgi:hypothetical protein
MEVSEIIDSINLTEIKGGTCYISPEYKKLGDTFVSVATKILHENGLPQAKAKVVPKVWATNCSMDIHKTNIEVQFGEDMFRRSSTPDHYSSNIYYCLKLLDTENWMTVTIAGDTVRKVAPSVKLASILLEEVAHAFAPYRAGHNEHFIYQFRKLWVKYFDYVHQEIKKVL